MQAKLIRDKLQEVKDHISAVRASGGTLEPVTQPAAPAAAAPLSGLADIKLVVLCYTLSIALDTMSCGLLLCF